MLFIFSGTSATSMKAPILISVITFHEIYRKTSRGSKAATRIIKELANTTSSGIVGGQ